MSHGLPAIVELLVVVADDLDVVLSCSTAKFATNLSHASPDEKYPNVVQSESLGVATRRVN